MHQIWIAKPLKKFLFLNRLKLYAWICCLVFLIAFFTHFLAHFWVKFLQFGRKISALHYFLLKNRPVCFLSWPVRPWPRPSECYLAQSFISLSMMCVPSPSPARLILVARSDNSLIASTCSFRKLDSRKSQRCASLFSDATPCRDSRDWKGKKKTKSKNLKKSIFVAATHSQISCRSQKFKFFTGFWADTILEIYYFLTLKKHKF